MIGVLFKKVFRIRIGVYRWNRVLWVFLGCLNSLLIILFKVLEFCMLVVIINIVVMVIRLGLLKLFNVCWGVSMFVILSRVSVFIIMI